MLLNLLPNEIAQHITTFLPHTACLSGRLVSRNFFDGCNRSLEDQAKRYGHNASSGKTAYVFMRDLEEEILFFHTSGLIKDEYMVFNLLPQGSKELDLISTLHRLKNLPIGVIQTICQVEDRGNFLSQFMVIWNPTQIAQTIQQDECFKHACENGWTAKVELMLRMGWDPNSAPYRSKQEGLRAAIRNDRVEVVRVLVKYGASPHVFPDGDIPLIVAVRSSHLPCEIIQFLTDARVDVRDCEALPNLLQHYNPHPDQRASKTAEKSLVKLVNILLKAGAPPNQDLRANCPMHLAFKKLKNNEPALKEILAALLNAGADPNLVNANGKRMINIAIKNRWKDCAQLLLEHDATPNCADTSNNTPLLITAERGDVEMLELLHQHDVDLDAVEPNRESAFHVALREGHIRYARELLNRGFDFQQLIREYFSKNNAEHRNYYFHGIVLASIYSDNYDDVFFHLDIAAKKCVSQRDLGGYLPLHWAALAGDIYLINQLLRHMSKSEINDRDNKSQCTALSLAQSPEVVEMLLKAGADASTIDLREVDASLIQKYVRVGKVSANTTYRTPISRETPILAWCVSEKQWKKVDALLECGADPKKCTRKQRSSLWYAVWQGNFHYVHRFLDLGVDPTVQDKDGYSPLSLAFERKHYREALIMLRHSRWERKCLKQLLDYIRKKEGF